MYSELFKTTTEAFGLHSSFNGHVSHFCVVRSKSSSVDGHGSVLAPADIQRGAVGRDD